jgi:hypothetical protein
MTDAQIREVFLAAGFEIKPGCDDLKPYVYKAARDLLALAEKQRHAALDDDGALWYQKDGKE